MGGATNNITGQENFSFNPDAFTYQFVPNQPIQMGDTGQAAIGQGMSQGISNLASGITSGIGKYKQNHPVTSENPANNPANYIGGRNPMYKGDLTYSDGFDAYAMNNIKSTQPPISPVLSGDYSFLSTINPSVAYMPSYWQ